MAKFHSLIVTDVENTIRDAIVVSLRPEEGAEAFDFTQGQYLTFRQEIEGTEIRRSYSICAGKGEGLRVGIKRVEAGPFPTGPMIRLPPACGLRRCRPWEISTRQSSLNAKKLYRFCRWIGNYTSSFHLKNYLNAEPQSKFTLVYANRGVNTIMLKKILRI